MRITLFKLPSHRVFNHIPIYYDEVKEEQKERERRIKDELGIDGSEAEMNRSAIEGRIRGKMRGRRESMFNVTRKEKNKSNIRLIIIIFILMALAYYMYSTSREWLDLITK
ncbi:hypothetical protein LX69_00860 [Breznakibacter xylanolyticus]|uniref:Uncharacterized protein n=1 Tax=Breznakibacter xylanolyticus TaxID=990 RepID=A0A2W7NIB8_9BACT|nr:hypothetical protein [Breznakibacter xylanolyticus]PZX19193.1 hypothetical protein LX69_00860 [Breznakibacter xylanolyticus]